MTQYELHNLISEGLFKGISSQNIQHEQNSDFVVSIFPVDGLAPSNTVKWLGIYSYTDDQSHMCVHMYGLMYIHVYIDMYINSHIYDIQLKGLGPRLPVGYRSTSTMCIHIQCGAVITWSIFFKILTIDIP